jgi:mannosyltransferase OCH1-like enzyme
MTWVDRDIFDHDNPMILNGLRNIRDLNPDWTVTIYLDHEVDSYIRQHVSASDYALINQCCFVERSDLWRLLKIYHEGGLYLDLDRYCNIPLNQIITPGIQCLLPMNGNWDFSQDIMCSAVGNPIYRRAIDLNLQRRRAGIRNIYYLGAQTYMHSITLELLGQMIDINPGPEIFQQLKNRIDQFDFIKTHKEILPYYTMIYQHNINTFKIGNGQSKLDFYRQFNVIHWEQQ